MLSNSDFRSLLPSQTPRVSSEAPHKGGKEPKNDPEMVEVRAKKKERKEFFKHWQKEKEEKEKELSSHYRDRAFERRKGIDPDQELEDPEAVLAAAREAVEKKRHDPAPAAPAAPVVESEVAKHVIASASIWDNSVKGLDVELLEKKRAEMAALNEAKIRHDVEEETHRDVDEAAKALSMPTAPLARAVYNQLFGTDIHLAYNDVFLPGRSTHYLRPSHVLPVASPRPPVDTHGRSTYIFPVDETDPFAALPTLESKLKSDCPPVPPAAAGGLTAELLEELHHIVAHTKSKRRGRLAKGSLSSRITQKQPPESSRARPSHAVWTASQTLNTHHEFAPTRFLSLPDHAEEVMAPPAPKHDPYAPQPAPLDGPAAAAKQDPFAPMAPPPPAPPGAPGAANPRVFGLDLISVYVMGRFHWVAPASPTWLSLLWIYASIIFPDAGLYTPDQKVPARPAGDVSQQQQPPQHSRHLRTERSADVELSVRFVRVFGFVDVEAGPRCSSMFTGCSFVVLPSEEPSNESRLPVIPGLPGMPKAPETEAQKRHRRMMQNEDADLYADGFEGQVYSTSIGAADGSDEDEDDATARRLKRENFATDAEYYKYKESQEVAPRAAFQFGLKMADGRKQGGKAGRKAGEPRQKTDRQRARKLDRDFERISVMIEKKHGPEETRMVFIALFDFNATLEDDIPYTVEGEILIAPPQKQQPDKVRVLTLTEPRRKGLIPFQMVRKLPQAKAATYFSQYEASVAHSVICSPTFYPPATPVQPAGLRPEDLLGNLPPGGPYRHREDPKQDTPYTLIQKGQDYMTYLCVDTRDSNRQTQAVVTVRIPPPVAPPTPPAPPRPPPPPGDTSSIPLASELSEGGEAFEAQVGGGKSCLCVAYTIDELNRMDPVVRRLSTPRFAEAYGTPGWRTPRMEQAQGAA
ncbi:hypothetical protein PAPYR_8865 [Paratrimastix pyriformis]|uniref:Uncharacterized protein n=1 Tax=Paratrimastix pyriformis TaxID=342808 RepID=A0ABQ8U9M9_9EUKA|nr:hypothetical protein PAPYR_8865 [Paratrimastix pyriformis]